MLPSRSRSNSATVSVRRILLVSCISVTAATETWRDCSIAALDACSRSFSDLLIAVVANSPADVIVRATSELLPSIDCAKVCPRVSIDLRASEVTRSTSVVRWVVLAPIVSTSANRTGMKPARRYRDMRRRFGNTIDFVLPGRVGDLPAPTPIRDGVTGTLVRAG